MNTTLGLVIGAVIAAVLGFFGFYVKGRSDESDTIEDKRGEVEKISADNLASYNRELDDILRKHSPGTKARLFGIIRLNQKYKNLAARHKSSINQ